MGAIKKKASKSRKGGKVAKTIKTAAQYVGLGGKSGSTGGKRRRMTPEALSKKILVEKLKKRLFRIKYGGGK